MFLEYSIYRHGLFKIKYYIYIYIEIEPAMVHLLLWYLVGALHKHKCTHHFGTLAPPSPFEPSPLCSAKSLLYPKP
jgi:hypothetical protein